MLCAEVEKRIQFRVARKFEARVDIWILVQHKLEELDELGCSGSALVQTKTACETKKSNKWPSTHTL